MMPTNTRMAAVILFIAFSFTLGLRSPQGGYVWIRRIRPIGLFPNLGAEVLPAVRR